MKPWISVIMPLRRSRHIIHVAIKSLLDQSNPPPWELIVLEDEDSALGRGYFEDILPSLASRGCVTIKYQSVEDDVSFVRKIGMSALMVDLGCRVVTFQCDDDYIPNDHFRKAWDNHIEHLYEGMFYRHGHFVDITRGKAILFDLDHQPKKNGLIGCYDAPKYRALPLEDGKWADNWMYNNIVSGLDGLLLVNNDPNESVFLNHGGNVAGGRSRMYDGPTGAFTKVLIEDVWMPDFIRQMVNQNKS